MESGLQGSGAGVIAQPDELGHQRVLGDGDTALPVFDAGVGVEGHGKPAVADGAYPLVVDAGGDRPGVTHVVPEAPAGGLDGQRDGEVESTILIPQVLHSPGDGDEVVVRHVVHRDLQVESSDRLGEVVLPRPGDLSAQGLVLFGALNELDIVEPEGLLVLQRGHDCDLNACGSCRDLDLASQQPPALRVLHQRRDGHGLPQQLRVVVQPLHVDAVWVLCYLAIEPHLQGGSVAGQP